MAWVENAAYIPMIALIGFLFLLFPTGKLPSRRWRPIAWFGVIGTVLGWASVEFSAGSLADFPSVTNPFGVAGASSVLSALGIFGLLLLGIFFLSSLASLLLRFLHAKGEERQQLKWFASAGVVVVVAIAVWSPDTAILSYLAILGLAVAVGIAILKYRLYEIDIIIRRTLIYSILTASLIFVYFLSVILLQRIFALLTGQSQSELVTVLSTLAIAALFIPLRNRIQDVIDRRLYRKKYDSQKVLQKFGEKVRDETDLDKLAGSLIEVVNETMQPTSMTVWLKPTVRGKSEGPNG
jgi:hypothetical protein